MTSLAHELGLSFINHYDPYGLNLTGIEKLGQANDKWQFNGGKTERNHELGLNWDETKYRSYDYQLGRFHQVDPKADDGDQESLTTYQFSLNNPIRYNDPDGDCPTCITGALGAGIGALVGGAIEAGTQLYEHGEVKDWGAVGGAAAQGLVTGGVAGLTGGASLLTTTLVSSCTNVVGGAINNAIQGKEITIGTVATDALIGAAAGGGGKLLDKTIKAVQLKETAQISGILRDASKGKGNFGLGTATIKQSDKAGKAWVGEGATLASDGKTLVSADKLRQYRPPSNKSSSYAKTGKQANFESRYKKPDVVQPDGTVKKGDPIKQWQSNGHLNIK